MGKYFDKFKNGAGKVDKKLADLSKDNSNPDIAPRQRERQKGENANAWTDMADGDMFDDFNDRPMNGNGGFNDFYDEPNIIPAQKPESFHHFILENQYKDLERSIRGFKDVYDKDTSTWIIKRKDGHCFTDEEAEEILRTAQSHLATDIKLSFVSKESFPLLMDAIFKQLLFLFRTIAEYRYGRYGNYEKQYQMKAQNNKIFLELMTRVQANYSRAIQGTENKNTHGSVKGQESLNNSDRIRDDFGRNRRWS